MHLLPLPGPSPSKQSAQDVRASLAALGLGETLQALILSTTSAGATKGDRGGGGRDPEVVLRQVENALATVSDSLPVNPASTTAAQAPGPAASAPAPASASDVASRLEGAIGVLASALGTPAEGVVGMVLAAPDVLRMPGSALQGRVTELEALLAVSDEQAVVFQHV